MSKNFKNYKIRLSGKLLIRTDFFLLSHSGLAREDCNKHHKQERLNNLNNPLSDMMIPK